MMVKMKMHLYYLKIIMMKHREQYQMIDLVSQSNVLYIKFTCDFALATAGWKFDTCVCR